jgi:hypothetical protein
MKNHIAAIAFIVGLISVGLAAFQNNFVHAPPSPKSEAKPRTLKEVASDAAKTLLEEKILHKEPLPKPVKDPRRLPLHPYQMTFTGLGILAIGLGIYAWTQKAHTRLAASAIGLGLMAIAWEWVLIAVAVAVVLFLLSLFG